MGELGRRFQRHMVLRFKPHSGDDPPRRGRGAPKRLARWRLRSPLRSFLINVQFRAFELKAPPPLESARFSETKQFVNIPLDTPPPHLALLLRMMQSRITGRNVVARTPPP